MNPYQTNPPETPASHETKRISGVKMISAYLQRAIETGAYSEGERLPPERKLAENFNTARSTVRRALDKLEKEGLVSRRLGSGTFVGTLSDTAKKPVDFIGALSPLELIDARVAVEPFTARLAAQHADAQTIEALEALLASVEVTGDQDAFAKCDGEFHLLLARASGNPFLIHVFRQINHVRLNPKWGAIKEDVLTPEAIAEYNRQHRAILDAIELRDALLAQKRMIEHLDCARSDLLKVLKP
ncbi:MAG: FadR family transcriptional regulator [Methyloceanibacter sp.]|uniref:FadR/GntR family transcriptional regulator n=1 Tax=Methyloceanibacter sp. TaxID=1965321 RepID=UPI001DA67059|nr:FadR/GntR family transcriptional regulator [Methyloceanibacter sp.]MCB1441702.1 FadR family transcriptional regulator [Methyloceanibacter sp.]